MFKAKFSTWLQKPLFEKKLPKKRVSSMTQFRKEFEGLSLSQKRRRTKDIRETESPALIFATTSVLRKEGHPKTAKIIEKAAKSPLKMESAMNLYDKQIVSHEMSAQKAMAVFLDCGLTKQGYNLLRGHMKDQATNKFPAYDKLLTAKKECYPQDIAIDETTAVVKLQSLLDHTATRLVKTFEQPPSNNIIIRYKWGFDGSSGQSEYKQIFQSDSLDASIFLTTLVPILVSDAQTEAIVWQNATPSSTRYCRPIRICFEKETEKVIKLEHERMQREINELTETKVGNATVEHRLYLTMVDGKTINVLENNKASSRCFICKAGPKNMNNIDRLEFDDDANLDESRFQYGLAPLHARIKFLEYLVHLSYRLRLPEEARHKGSRLTESQKQLVQETKSDIQDKLRSQLGIIVDAPKQGYGSSNDGNTSRTFFEQSEITADILKVDPEVIKRFAIILIAINTSAAIDPEKFGEYSKRTAELLVEKYSYWTMSPTVHKVLCHGRTIMKSHTLSTGTLSEEALEHRNKDIKKYRRDNARKTSRVDNLTDVFHRLLQTSDPLVTSLRACPRSKKVELPPEVQKMLKTYQDSDEDDDQDLQFPHMYVT